jgi:butyrate kinase
VKVVIYPGEDEMEALAMSGLRILKGEKCKEY